MADAWLAGLPEGGLEATLPMGSVDRARFWLTAARRLWDKNVLQSLARAEMPTEISLAVGA